MARITVKGIPHDTDITPEAPLRSLLREQLGLTGASAEARKAAPEVPQRSFCRVECLFSGMLHG